jgi:hypothetical protein
MSGLNSSNPSGDVDSQGVNLSVHSMAVPDLQASQRRTRIGRWKMFGVLALCASPVIASYLTYYVIRPDGRSNYGALIQPSRAIPSTLSLMDMQGRAVAPKSLHGQWLLIAAGPADCGTACLERQHALRQLRTMLGREKDRLDKVWLVVGEGDVATDLRQPPVQDPSALVLRVRAEEVQAWLQQPDAKALESHLFVVDPMGEHMMRFPWPMEPSRVKRDLERLLRASAFWDKAGR